MTLLSSFPQGRIPCSGPAAVPGESRAPASPVQARLWMLAQIGGGDAIFHEALGARLTGPLDVRRLKDCFSALAARHPMLRTRFERLPWGEVEQVTLPQGGLDWSYEDVGALSPSEREQRLHLLSENHARAAFDLENAGLLRCHLVRLTASAHMVFLAGHQLILDGLSLRHLVEDLLAIYGAGQGGQELVAAPPDAYADYARKLKQALDANAFDQDLAEQCRKLGGEQAVLDLPVERAGPPAWSHATNRLTLCLDRDVAAAVDDLARNTAAGREAVLLACLDILLYRYCGQTDLRIGRAVANRSGAEAKRLIGPLANIRLHHARLDGATILSDLLRQVGQDISDDDRLEALPFEILADALQPDRMHGMTPLFQVMVDYRGADFSPLRPGGLEVEFFPCDSGSRRCELSFMVQDEPDGRITLIVDYARGLFRRDVVERMAGHLQTVMRGMTAAPGSRIDALPLMEEAEIARLSAPLPWRRDHGEAPVHRLIERQAMLRPKAPAVICGDRAMTFGELDRAANRLAHRLRRMGVGTEARVGVALARSPEMIVALLAVLKAQGGFVPLDPDYPPERLSYILADAGVELILTEEPLRRHFDCPDGVSLLALDGLDLSAEEDGPVTAENHPGQLAYAIYTSGSTGQPKGVEVAHGPLAMHCVATGQLYEMGPSSRELHFLSISFDGAHERWMVPLIFGGCVVLRGPELWSAAETLDNIRRHHVTNAGFPASYLHQLAEWAEQTGEAPPVFLYSFGGEAMPGANFDLIRKALRPHWLINGYGPTETVISPLAWKVPATAAVSGSYAPIGRAVGARRAYVLDADLNPVPVGVTGELYIGGEGLARGYCGRAAATAERFIPDPFRRDGGRLYRTGDRARWLEDGSIDYVGRTDHQIKLRGFRIEPGEIEAKLRALEQVGDAIVLLREGPAGRRLIAYVLPAPGAAVDPVAARVALSRDLPDYMVPSAIVVLERFPVTPNGKIDRAALPDPVIEEEQAVPPEGAAETRIAAIWSEVLGMGTVGVTHNFFELGGDSLAALKVVSRLRSIYPDKQITVLDLFNNPDIRRLAAALEQNAVGRHQVVHMRKTGSRPVLYCLPGLLVSTREYGGLVRHLGENQPATGFICHSLSEDRGEQLSIEELAARYADYIRAHTPPGGCHMVGWSWGGILAYEAARMLAGEVDVKFVGMLDVCALDAEFAPGVLSPLSEERRARIRNDIARWLERSAMRADWDRVLARMDGEVYEQFLRFVNKSKEGLPTDGPEVGSREHIFWTLIENALVFRNYVMRPSNCRIHAWIAEDSLTRGYNVIDWRAYSKRAERVEVIRGATHLDIIRSEAFHRSFAESVDMVLAKS